MGISECVHGPQTLGRLDEGIDDLHHLPGRPHIKRPAIHQFHDQERFLRLHQEVTRDL